MDKDSRDQMIRLAIIAFQKNCDIIYPADGKLLASECSKALLKTSTNDEDHALKENMVSLIKALPPRSLHRRIMLAPVTETYKGHVFSTQLGIKKKSWFPPGEISP